MRTTFVRAVRGYALPALVLLAVSACSASATSQAPSSHSMSSPAAGSPAALPEGFPIGTWSTTITEADLRAGGLTQEGELTENAGVISMTMASDGTWSSVQESEVDLRWPVFQGTWTIVDADTFRQTTTFPPDFAGDVVDFTWNMEGEELRLHVDNPPDPVLPIITETHPWHSTN